MTSRDLSVPCFPIPRWYQLGGPTLAPHWTCLKGGRMVPRLTCTLYHVCPMLHLATYPSWAPCAPFHCHPPPPPQTPSQATVCTIMYFSDETRMLQLKKGAGVGGGWGWASVPNECSSHRGSAAPGVGARVPPQGWHALDSVTCVPQSHSTQLNRNRPRPTVTPPRLTCGGREDSTASNNGSCTNKTRYPGSAHTDKHLPEQT